MPDARAIEVNGEHLLATAPGALFWPARTTLIVADLHFEKGASFARRGVMLPPYDTRTTLRRLAVLCRRYRPEAIISLGDAFHEEGADAGMEAEDADHLAALINARRWIWVLGNHDPAPPSRFAGDVARELRVGGLVFRHEPRAPMAAGDVAGHLHPCAKIRADARMQRRRCFLSDGGAVILPAFGAYTGGLNVLDEAFEGLMDAPTPFALGSRGVYPIARRLLAPDETATIMSRRAG